MAESKIETDLFSNEAAEMVNLMQSQGTKINSVNDLVRVVAPLMRLAKKYTHLDGDAKKTVVINSCKYLVKLSKLEDDIANPILFAIDTIIPPMIDELYDLKMKDFKKLFSCC